MDVATPLRTPATAGGGRSADDAAGVDVVEPRRSSTPRRYLARLVSVVASLAVVAIAAVAVALTLVPALVSGHAVTVLSPSMTPDLPAGSVLVDKPVAADSLRVGDVITYATTDQVSGAPILITHRIVEIGSGSGGPTFITKGDANNAADDRPVEAAQVRGKVWYHVPYIGVVRNFLLAQGAGLIIGGAVALVAAVWFLVHLMGSEPKPQNATGSADARRVGRHRARNGAVGTALAALLVTGTQLVAQPAGTLAHFSDQQGVGFEITVGSADPAQ